MPQQDVKAIVKRYFAETDSQTGKWTCSCGKTLIQKKNTGWSNLFIPSGGNKFKTCAERWNPLAELLSNARTVFSSEGIFNGWHTCNREGDPWLFTFTSGNIGNSKYIFYYEKLPIGYPGSSARNHMYGGREKHFWTNVHWLSNYVNVTKTWCQNHSLTKFWECHNQNSELYNWHPLRGRKRTTFKFKVSRDIWILKMRPTLQQVL